MKKFLLLVCLLAGTVLWAQKNKPAKVLFVGNSYTFYHNLPDLVERLGKSVGFPIDATACTKASQRFTGHLQNKKLLRMLAVGGWDYVVLQEQSEAPALPTERVVEGTYRPARTLDSLVHAGSPQARVIYYMTWGRKEGSKTYGAYYPPVATYEGMQQRLATSYLEMAYRSGGWCAPVGLAWMRVRNEQPGYELYMPDGSHPSEAGTLLAANVIFSVIYGKPYTSDIRAGVPQQQAEYLQQTAQQTVFDNLRLINVEPAKPGPPPEIALPRK